MGNGGKEGFMMFPDFFHLEHKNPRNGRFNLARFRQQRDQFGQEPRLFPLSP